MPTRRNSTTCCWKNRHSRSKRRRSSCTRPTRGAPVTACTTSSCSAASTCLRSSSPRAMPSPRRVKTMCRRYAETGLVSVVALLLLAACGSSPPAPEKEAKTEKAAKVEKGAAKQEAPADATAAPVEEVLPPEAVQRFDQAVVHMSAGDVATAE